MKTQHLAMRVAGTIFGVVAALHVARLLTGVVVIIGPWEVPTWVNAVGAIVTGGLCIWLWRLSRDGGS